MEDGSEMKLLSKTRKQARKGNKHENQHTFKHVNKKVCKSEFGIWGKTKGVKMNVFNIFKEKMHFSWHPYQQM